MADESNGVIKAYNPRYLSCGCLIWDNGILKNSKLDSDASLELGVAANHEFFDTHRGLSMDYSSTQFFLSFLWRSREVGRGVRFTGGSTIDASIDNYRLAAFRADSIVSISPFVGIEAANGLSVRFYPQNLNLSRLLHGVVPSSGVGVELGACLDKTCAAWAGVGAYIFPKGSFDGESDHASSVFFRIGAR
ncbi:MAG TPA: hypothetical protein PKU96_05195 [bacterium]|nr:hypothetical protein [bacterium]HQG13319.1 hypothetical protein [bacterium]